MRIFALFVALFLGANAHASTYTYHYQGGLMDAITDDSYGIGESYDPYSATLVLDEALLGQSLRNANIQFHFGYPGSPPSGPIQGILGFYVNHVDVFNTVAGATFTLQTDDSGNITTGLVDWLDGPPDGGFGGTGPHYNGYYDWLHNSEYTVWSRRPGYWTTVSVSGEPYVSPVPLPAAAWMLLAGVMSLTFIKKRGKLIRR